MPRHSNQEIASRYIGRVKPTTLYEYPTAKVWRYNGKIWEIMSQKDLEDDIAFMCDDTIDLPKSLTMASYRDVSEQTRRLMRRNGMYVEEIDDRFLSFNDCVLETSTWETFGHEPKRAATIHIDYDYASIGSVKTPLFDEYLKASIMSENGTPDAKIGLLLQEMAGYLLTTENAHKCFILYGDGGTGKSVFLDILRRLVSTDLCLSMGLADMTKKDFNLPALIGKRANIKDEEHASSNDIGTLKSIIAGEPMTTRDLYGRPFQYRPKVKLYFGSNTYPILNGFDESIKRRFIIAPFDHKIPREKMIRGLSKKMEDAGEIPGIIRWALEGLKRLQQTNFTFTENDRTMSAMREFQASSSSVFEYIESEWERDESAQLPGTMIYEGYKGWCESTNRRPVSLHTFGREAGQQFGKAVNKRINGIQTKCYEARRRPKSDDSLLSGLNEAF